VKTEQEIRDKLAEIDTDERYHSPVATIVENAPLALIQMGLEEKAAALAWVLGIKPPVQRRVKKGRAESNDLD
jgi:hypothetical protein